MLHGLGDSGDGWAPVGAEWAPELKHCKFVFPHAPNVSTYASSNIISNGSRSDSKHMSVPTVTVTWSCGSQTSSCQQQLQLAANLAVCILAQTRRSCQPGTLALVCVGGHRDCCCNCALLPAASHQCEFWYAHAGLV